MRLHKVPVTQGAALDSDSPLNYLHKLQVEHFLQSLNGKILPQANRIVAVSVNVPQNGSHKKWQYTSSKIDLKQGRNDSISADKRLRLIKQVAQGFLLNHFL